MRPAPLHLRVSTRGLSLVEVLVAVAICAGAVTLALALLGPLGRATRETAERRAALRLVERLDLELQRRPTWVPAGGASGEFFATADAARLVPRPAADNDPVSGAPPGIPPAARYFRLELTAEPGFAKPGSRVWRVRVTWPFQLPPDGTATPEPQRAEWRAHLATNR